MPSTTHSGKQSQWPSPATRKTCISNETLLSKSNPTEHTKQKKLQEAISYKQEWGSGHSGVHPHSNTDTVGMDTSNSNLAKKSDMMNKLEYLPIQIASSHKEKYLRLSIVIIPVIWFSDNHIMNKRCLAHDPVSKKISCFARSVIYYESVNSEFKYFDSKFDSQSMTWVLEYKRPFLNNTDKTNFQFSLKKAQICHEINPWTNTNCFTQIIDTQELCLHMASDTFQTHVRPQKFIQGRKK